MCLPCGFLVENEPTWQSPDLFFLPFTWGTEEVVLWIGPAIVLTIYVMCTCAEGTVSAESDRFELTFPKIALGAHIPQVVKRTIVCILVTRTEGDEKVGILRTRLRSWIATLFPTNALPFASWRICLRFGDATITC